ncbi:hypothetical protein [Pseudomonas sp.]|uniref:hypothetical protein n=1 Tax=Pseudomonas sp. TaxID=306 RepID=UPI002E37EE5D|nr:hypothetical protein [Pseudomonas sp.]HEX4551166.1 hypothetical protein [Pseudomonas sp.]
MLIINHLANTLTVNGIFGLKVTDLFLKNGLKVTDLFLKNRSVPNFAVPNFAPILQLGAAIAELKVSD